MEEAAAAGDLRIPATRPQLYAKTFLQQQNHNKSYIRTVKVMLQRLTPHKFTKQCIHVFPSLVFKGFCNRVLYFASLIFAVTFFRGTLNSLFFNAPKLRKLSPAKINTKQVLGVCLAADLSKPCVYLY